MCLASAAACGCHREHAVLCRAVVDRARPARFRGSIRPSHRGAHMAHIGPVGGSVCDLVSRRTLSRGARRAHRAVRAEPGGTFGRIHLFDARASHEPREKALGGSLQSHRVMFCCFRGMSGHIRRRRRKIVIILGELDLIFVNRSGINQSRQCIH